MRAARYGHGGHGEIALKVGVRKESMGMTGSLVALQLQVVSGDVGVGGGRLYVWVRKQIRLSTRQQSQFGGL